MGSWGHPSTTGLRTLDVFISSAALEPPDAEQHYSEELLRLPGIGCCYEPLVRPAAAQRTGDGSVRFISCQTPFKYLPQHDALYPQIAQRVPGARFVFFEYFASAALAATLRRRLEAAFRAAGLDPAAYCEFRRWQPGDAFMQTLAEMDIYLDTPGFSGFNTAMQALGAGLPVVTLEGDLLRSRLAAGLLRTLGLTDTIALTPQQFVDMAVACGTDAQARQAWRDGLAGKLEGICNDPQPVHALETVMLARASLAAPGSDSHR
jgi:predicted O-linked N-acetylglucosamine transferase (SPINDLY family)